MIKSPRLTVFCWDLAVPFSVGLKKELGDIHAIFHLAAESHVPFSITNPVEFVKNNVDSTLYLLEYARELGPKLYRFFNMSTDEVFGNAPEGTSYKETDRHNPGNPYSASKSAGEMLCLSYHNTYGLPYIGVNCMNVIGIRQTGGKFVGLCMDKISKGETIKIHSIDGVSGSRNYVNARDVASAILYVYNHGDIGSRYNIPGCRDVSNLELAQTIARHMGEDLKYELVEFDESRPGFDFRYSLDGTKLKELGWTLNSTFDDTIKEIVDWTMEHPHWIR
jgi:dTDP-glucose 4,6-dehydratase